ncbi:MAG: hypothetical protein HY661_07380 [Betaproteobacteria bacterium]|nr:hypothetical protein [Betaproteobacteria bacterium]
MAGEELAASAASEKAGADAPKYERSTIEFPYGDLSDAIEVAVAIHKNAGISCSTDQLAAYMNQAATSGAFRLKVGTARIFGLVETTRGSVALTDLGRRIVDPAQERKAKNDAFLAVPLYKAIFEKYKGHLLPPTAALKREIGKLGVSSKQTDRARQALERSADQAGFFAHGKDKLVMPSGLTQPESQKSAPETKKIEDRDIGRGGNDGGDLPPFIQGLLSKLPNEGEVWPIADRANWLRTASNIFGLMYKAEEGNAMSSINIEVAKL